MHGEPVEGGQEGERLGGGGNSGGLTFEAKGQPSVPPYRSVLRGWGSPLGGRV